MNKQNQPHSFLTKKHVIEHNGKTFLWSFAYGFDLLDGDAIYFDAYVLSQNGVGFQTSLKTSAIFYSRPLPELDSKTATILENYTTRAHSPELFLKCGCLMYEKNGEVKLSGFIANPNNVYPPDFSKEDFSFISVTRQQKRIKIGKRLLQLKDIYFSDGSCLEEIRNVTECHDHIFSVPSMLLFYKKTESLLDIMRSVLTQPETPAE